MKVFFEEILVNLKFQRKTKNTSKKRLIFQKQSLEDREIEKMLFVLWN